MKDIVGSIKINKMISPDTYVLEINCNLGAWRPGQFVMLQVNDTCDPFLRRPLGILNARGNTLELLYRVKGRGTHLLAHKKPGDQVSILGPLGNGFSIPAKNAKVVYIAGGTGIPPITALAEFAGSGCLIAGYRSKTEAALAERVRDIRDVECVIVTEDGSLGKRGMVTDIISNHPDLDVISKIYACGPFGMLRAIAQFAASHKIACEVSLEERMGCGFGVCSGCAVMTTAGVKRVCKDGPIFDAKEIIWDQPWD